MSYDLVIVAQSSDQKLIDMTQNCINSAMIDDLNVILIETSGSYVYYQGVNRYINYSGNFNYNHALNMGLEFKRGDVHILANNDLIFYPGWQQIGEYMLTNGFDSASAWFAGSVFPQGDHIYEGYGIATHLTGWCLFITQNAMNKIGRLREDVDFWYSDNVYANQLKEHGLRHGLFCNVRVDHIGSKTLKSVPIRMQRYYSQGQITKYNRLCGKKR